MQKLVLRLILSVLYLRHWWIPGGYGFLWILILSWYRSVHVYSVRIQAFPDYANKMDIKFFRQKNAQIMLDSQNKAKVAL